MVRRKDDLNVTRLALYDKFDFERLFYLVLNRTSGADKYPNSVLWYPNVIPFLQSSTTPLTLLYRKLPRRAYRSRR